MPSVIFCQCGSDKVDVRYWDDKDTPVIACASCGKTANLPGFTLGRFGYTVACLEEARNDRAVMNGLYSGQAED